MGQAAQQLQGVALKMKLDDAYRKVLTALAQYRSMPFLELTAVCDIGDDKLEDIIDDLEGQDMVKVSNRDNILEEIVTLKKKGLEIVGYGA
jgi:antitoxin component of RelBE/YafQ-DinJ toxin-antitoxin module